jgi:hypothetical protein
LGTQTAEKPVRRRRRTFERRWRRARTTDTEDGDGDRDDDRSRREGDAVAGFDAVETSGSTDALANALTRGALDALERGKDFGAFVATTGGERGRERAMEAIVESRAIERNDRGDRGEVGRGAEIEVGVIGDVRGGGHWG